MQAHADLQNDALFPSISRPTLLQRSAQHLVARRVRITTLVAVGLVTRILLKNLTPHSPWDVSDANSLVGLSGIAAGLGMRSWATGVLQKNKTLATTGPYAVTRNPLYLGSLLVLSGFCVLLNAEFELVLLASPLGALYFVQMLHEERALREQFPGHWVRYASAVPRFFPRGFPSAPFATWRLECWVGNREYRALAAVLIGLLGLELWRIA